MKPHRCAENEIAVFDKDGKYKPCLVCFAEKHGFDETDIARAFASLRSYPAGGRPRKKYAKRCPCGQNTLTRAKARNFDCCKKAGKK